MCPYAGLVEERAKVGTVTRAGNTISNLRILYCSTNFTHYTDSLMPNEMSEYARYKVVMNEVGIAGA